MIEADFGPRLAEKLSRSATDYDDLCNKIRAIIFPHISSIPTTFLTKPAVIILVGVNGSGKTTTVAKLAHYLQNAGLSVSIAACDTFRAAAEEQLFVWAEKLKCKFYSGKSMNPASVAYTACTQTNDDVLLVDTAGRLQNNTNLMAELSKIRSVITKITKCDPISYITIDATSGQNIVQQVDIFNNACKLSGIILNKTDCGTKCGCVVRAIDTLNLPIVAVGNGENVQALQKFDLDRFLKYELIQN